MSPFILPATVIVPGLVLVLWSVFAVRRATASTRWDRVVGTVVSHEIVQGFPLDVVDYPLPEGGTHVVRPEEHGHYESGRAVGARVPLWRDPQDPLNAVLELPRLERFAAPLLVGILGGFFAVAGCVWAALIWALLSR